MSDWGRPYPGHARAQRHGGHHAGGHGRRPAPRRRSSYASGPSDFPEEDWGFPIEDDDEESDFFDDDDDDDDDDLQLASDFDGGHRRGGTPPLGRHGPHLRRRHPSGSAPSRRSGPYASHDGPSGHQRGHPGYPPPGRSHGFSHRPAPGHYGHVDDIEIDHQLVGYTSNGNPIYQAREPGHGPHGPGGRAHRGNSRRAPPGWEDFDLEEDFPNDYDEIEAYIRERDRLEDEALFGYSQYSRHGDGRRGGGGGRRRGGRAMEGGSDESW
ncbi:MAG: hypothetical protein Q9225_000701 [Loekoesia sp. 1 TL-2023]